MDETRRESELTGLPPAPEETGPLYCHYCGEEIPDRACQCPECDRRIDPVEAPSVEQINRRNLPGLVLLAIYSAVVAICSIVTSVTSLLNDFLAPPENDTTPTALVILIAILG